MAPFEALLLPEACPFVGHDRSARYRLYYILRSAVSTRSIEKTHLPTLDISDVGAVVLLFQQLVETHTSTKDLTPQLPAHLL